MQHHSFFRNYRDINRNEQSCYGDEAGAFESVESSGGIVVRVLASHHCVPGLIPRLSAICGLSLLLVLFLASRGFPAGTLVFPSPQNQHFQIPIQSGLLSALCHEPVARVFAQALGLCSTLNLHVYICFFFVFLFVVFLDRSD